MAEKKGGELRAFYWVLGATAVVAVGSLGWSALGGGLSSSATEPIASIVTGDMEDLGALVEMATGVERGDPDAPITILEFGDFQCPACQQFAALVKPQIDLAYVDEGIARFVFHDYPGPSFACAEVNRVRQSLGLARDVAQGIYDRHCRKA